MCDQEPSTLDLANALIKRCQSTILTVTATPKGSKGSLERGERANLTIQRQRQLRTFRKAVSLKWSWTWSRVDGLDDSTLCMGCESFPSERNRENALSFYPGSKTTPEKLCHLEKWALGEITQWMDPNWTWGGYDEFFCRQAWPHRWIPVVDANRSNENTLSEASWRQQCLGFAILESVCGSSVECDSKEHAAGTNNPIKGWVDQWLTCEKAVLATEHFGQVRTFCWMPRVRRNWTTHRSAEQELSKRWWTKARQLKLEHLKILCKSQMPVWRRGGWWARCQSRRGVKLNGRHTQVERIWTRNQCGEWKCTCWVYCGSPQAVVWHAICWPQQRSHCTEWKVSGKWLESRPRTGVENMLNFDAFELVHKLPPGKNAYDMLWVDKWRGDRTRSRLCVHQFKAEGLRNDLLAGTPDTFFINYLLAKAASCKEFGVLVVDISVSVVLMHARTDEEIYVKVPSDIRSSKFWRLRAALNRTRKASKHWQEYSSDKLVTNMLFKQNDINPCIYKRFHDNLDF